jgi:hypothetical protein
MLTLLSNQLHRGSRNRYGARLRTVNSQFRALVGQTYSGSLGFTPTGEGTNVKVQLSGLGAEDAAFYRQLWARQLDRIAAAFSGAEPSALPAN